jgi:hypothetical protein
MPTTKWIKSSFSFSNSNCVEVRGTGDGGVQLRDSKDPDGSVLSFTAGEWDAFIKGAQAGEFDQFGQ